MPSQQIVSPALCRASVGALVAVLCGSAAAQNIGMPPGARQWIELKGNWVEDGICCDDAVGGVGSIPFPSPNYRHDSGRPGGIVYANADCTANRIRVSYWQYHTGGDPAFLHNSMLDTYTISGPPGTEGTPVDARLRFRAVGTIFVGEAFISGGLPLHVGTSSAQIEVGTWNGTSDPTVNEQGRVNEFGPDFERRSTMPFANYGTVMPTQSFDLLIDQTLARTVGAPFDLAFGYNVSGSGAGDLSGSTAPADSEYIVATIDWDLPPGYTITSMLGWSDPDGCPADYNGDGFVDGIDSDSFNNDFEAGDPAADYNDDGFVDGIDSDQFNNDFEAGC